MGHALTYKHVPYDAARAKMVGDWGYDAATADGLLECCRLVDAGERALCGITHDGLADALGPSGDAITCLQSWCSATRGTFGGLVSPAPSPRSPRPEGANGFGDGAGASEGRAAEPAGGGAA